ncbi:hypothetical protein GAP31_097 [Cronobacter phage vB_CsaM_GAP31]|uniref:Uncharacterized protein n=1 Tax=Cronobacter phage vB_CsaM_GAP31 TaxID=1141135 RepID=K4F6Q3_9CAUD|nr:hypothetical protein GAP31_097 [Cronobacter phage vB_CsaM_GAP31]AFC21277.1 hypothetical protein GAP31_097 [Cronobacter phage vB_CsaM_GAP31]
MRVSNDMKDFLVGFPVVLFCAVAIIWLISKLGPAALAVVGLLVILGFVGVIVGSVIRENFRIWK